MPILQRLKLDAVTVFCTYGCLYSSHAAAYAVCLSGRFYAEHLSFRDSMPRVHFGFPRPAGSTVIRPFYVNIQLSARLPLRRGRACDSQASIYHLSIPSFGRSFMCLCFGRSFMYWCSTILQPCLSASGGLELLSLSLSTDVIIPHVGRAVNRYRYGLTYY